MCANTGLRSNKLKPALTKLLPALKATRSDGDKETESSDSEV